MTQYNEEILYLLSAEASAEVEKTAKSKSRLARKAFRRAHEGHPSHIKKYKVDAAGALTEKYKKRKKAMSAGAKYRKGKWGGALAGLTDAKASMDMERLHKATAKGFKKMRAAGGTSAQKKKWKRRQKGHKAAAAYESSARRAGKILGITAGGVSAAGLVGAGAGIGYLASANQA